MAQLAQAKPRLLCSLVCAVVTSYNPSTRDIVTEDTGANTETEKEYIYQIYLDLLKNVTAKPGKTKTEVYEDEVKEQFVKEPAHMRLLVVVDKLLTGFDAPSCTYLYIDKSMQDPQSQWGNPRPEDL